MSVVRLAPFDPQAELSAFTARQSGAGAVVSFLGLCRDNGGRVTALVLDHFPGFTESEIERLVADTRQRFAVQDLYVVHRAGRVLPGEAIVLVAAAAAHRRAAFEAVDRLMDYLKTEAPFWKKEEGPNGGDWIEPRGEDHADKTRWTDNREA